MQQFILALIVMLLVSCSTAKRPLTGPKKKVVIAHRGAPGYLPEHTLAGVTLAHSWGVDYIEPDVVMTKDDHLIVLHDIHLDTTTNVAKVFPHRKRSDGRYYAIDFTLPEIEQLTAYERINLKTQENYFPKRFQKGATLFRVPTLSEYIALIQGLNRTTGRAVGIYVEFKSPAFHFKEGKDIAAKLLAVLGQYGYTGKNSGAIIQCFDAKYLKKLRPKTALPLVQLIADNSWKESDNDYEQMMTQQGLKEIATYADGIGPWITFILGRQNVVAWAHQYGLYVHAYTLRKEQIPVIFKNIDEFHEALFFKHNIDGLFTDFGDLTLNFLKNR